MRAGRDFGLFSRGNLFMNYELGHAYGVGFPCAYEKMFGGACGHVGFGTLWPDFHAQLTYSTPWFGDIFQLSAGVFDPGLFRAATLMVMVTTFMAPPLLKLLFPPVPREAKPPET